MFFKKKLEKINNELSDRINEINNRLDVLEFREKHGEYYFAINDPTIYERMRFECINKIYSCEYVYENKIEKINLYSYHYNSNYNPEKYYIFEDSNKNVIFVGLKFDRKEIHYIISKKDKSCLEYSPDKKYDSKTNRWYDI